MQERFHGCVQPEPTTGCWLWTGNVAACGYGRMSVNNRQVYAHRLSWALHCGGDPGDRLVLHRCDTPLCVNPDHLFLGSDGDNMRDMVAKRRHSNTLKTHCPHGHPYSGDNLHILKHGKRRCRACERESAKRIAERRGAQCM